MGLNPPYLGSALLVAIQQCQFHSTVVEPGPGCRSVNITDDHRAAAELGGVRSVQPPVRQKRCLQSLGQIGAAAMALEMTQTHLRAAKTDLGSTHVRICGGVLSAKLIARFDKDIVGIKRCRAATAGRYQNDPVSDQRKHCTRLISIWPGFASNGISHIAAERAGNVLIASTIEDFSVSSSMSRLPRTGLPVWLFIYPACLDRTNWKIGKRDVIFGDVGDRDTAVSGP